MARHPNDESERDASAPSARLTPGRMVRWGVALLVAGMVVAAVGTSTAVDAVGVTLGGIGAVALISAAFFAVGLAEDRAREAERRRRP